MYLSSARLKRDAPYVVITSNNTRDLSDALKRRCLHLCISYPDEQRELEIVRLKVPTAKRWPPRW